MLGASDPSTTLWWADQRMVGGGEHAVRPTGFALLDVELPGGGWPQTGLTELCSPVVGGAEWWLLAPSLAKPALQDHTLRPIFCVAPPHSPYVPALVNLGLAPERLLKVMPASAPDAAWATEQGLKSGACAAVLWWVSANIRTDALNNTLRRLQLAAKTCETPVFVLRSAEARQQASPASLRLALDVQAPGALAVTVFKRRGLPMAQPLVLSAPFATPSALRRWQALTLNTKIPTKPSAEAQRRHPSSIHTSSSETPLRIEKDHRNDVVRMASARLAA